MLHSQCRFEFKGFGVRILSIILLLAAVSLPNLSLAQSRAAIESQFQTWLHTQIWPKARGKGVSRATFDAAFDSVSLDWDLPGLVLPNASQQAPKALKQAEFNAPARYFRPSSVEGTSAMGRRMARTYGDILRRIEQKTGVPGRIVLGIWGRESGYGQVPVRHDVFRVLATKGFMSTRKAYFSDELIAALQIAQAGHAPNSAMKSSWAGALGQPQFMPSSFLKYAVDGDGDRRADIWRSEADTIASIAGYLQKHGWVKGRDWGFEVNVPASVSCTMVGPDQGLKIKQWVDLGVTRVSGKPFPKHELRGKGFLMMPAGRHGPAFIVTPNFYVLKEYNRSDLYALFVGHVGDRIQFGQGNFRGDWRPVDTLYRSEIAAMQRGLERLGHDVGGADGLPGFKTRRSIGRWQESLGRVATCFPEKSMIRALK